MMRNKKLVLGSLAVMATLGMIAIAVIYRTSWWPLASKLWPNPGPAISPVSSDAHGSGAPSGNEHNHSDHLHGHGEGNSIVLSPAALKNIGFRPYTVSLGVYERTVTLPAMVVERPGRSQMHVTAPMAGVVTRIFPIQGAAVEPGGRLFEVRLTHEELVTAQREFLRTAESLDVVRLEVERLKRFNDGVIAGRRVIEQEYEEQKLAASLRADKQALLLHGLDEGQIQQILDTRQLLSTLTVRAPLHDDADENCADDHLFHVQRLPVAPGQHVEAGEVLCVLADHCELYLEGRAYEDDAQQLRHAVRSGYTLSASLLVGQRRAEVVGGLQLLYLADQIDPASRAFHFYLPLPNEVMLDRSTPSGQRFIEWRFKPGQRMELRVPVERLENQMVLPSTSVVEDGAENFVYQQNGDHFDQVAVHVLARDQQSVVIAADGALFPGDVVAAQGAYQMHLAWKNQSGGALDPHAGHNH